MKFKILQKHKNQFHASSRIFGRKVNTNYADNKDYRRFLFIFSDVYFSDDALLSRGAGGCGRYEYIFRW